MGSPTTLLVSSPSIISLEGELWGGCRVGESRVTHHCCTELGFNSNIGSRHHDVA